LITRNQADFAALPLAQIMSHREVCIPISILAVAVFISAWSEASTGCSTTTANSTVVAVPSAPAALSGATAGGPEITYQPTNVRGVWSYLYLVINVWSRILVAWDGVDREDPAVATALVSLACLMERISKA
jgi:hypothetical protein